MIDICQDAAHPQGVAKDATQPEGVAKDATQPQGVAKGFTMYSICSTCKRACRRMS